MWSGYACLSMDGGGDEGRHGHMDSGTTLPQYPLVTAHSPACVAGRDCATFFLLSLLFV